MTKIKVLFAVQKGCPDYLEELITEQEEHIEEAKEWAKNKGFHLFRIADIDLNQKPDFVSTINFIHTHKTQRTK